MSVRALTEKERELYWRGHAVGLNRGEQRAIARRSLYADAKAMRRLESEAIDRQHRISYLETRDRENVRKIEALESRLARAQQRIVELGGDERP